MKSLLVWADGTLQYVEQTGAKWYETVDRGYDAREPAVFVMAGVPTTTPPRRERPPSMVVYVQCSREAYQLATIGEAFERYKADNAVLLKELVKGARKISKRRRSAP